MNDQRQDNLTCSVSLSLVTVDGYRDERLSSLSANVMNDNEFGLAWSMTDMPYASASDHGVYNGKLTVKFHLITLGFS